MPYEIHAYCISERSPTIRELLTLLRDEEDGPGLDADVPETAPEELDSPQWEECFMQYARKGSKKKQKQPLTLTLGCYRNTGAESSCAKMAHGRIETVSAYRDSPGKKLVLDCLSKTRYIIWCRVDNDPDRERASPVLDLLASLLSKQGAVYDLEDEGFLADSDTPLCGWCNHDE